MAHAKYVTRAMVLFLHLDTYSNPTVEEIFCAAEGETVVGDRRCPESPESLYGLAMGQGSEQGQKFFMDAA